MNGWAALVVAIVVAGCVASYYYHDRLFARCLDEIGAQRDEIRKADERANGYYELACQWRVHALEQGHAPVSPPTPPRRSDDTEVLTRIPALLRTADYEESAVAT